MGRDASLTKRTRRQMLVDQLVGHYDRPAAIVAAMDALITAGGLTDIDTATFGVFANAAGNNNCAITATDTTLTCAANPWSAGDVGKRIHVQGAGAAGATLSTTIAAFTSAGSIELADAAGTTVAPSATSASGIAVWGDIAVETIADADEPHRRQSPGSLITAADVDAIFEGQPAIAGDIQAGDTFLLLQLADGTTVQVSYATLLAQLRTGLPFRVVVATGTLTLDAEDHNGAIIVLTHAAACIVTVPEDLPVNFSCLLYGSGAGDYTVVAGGGATIRNADGHNGLALQYAVASLYVVENADDESAVAVFQGQTDTI